MLGLLDGKKIVALAKAKERQRKVEQRGYDAAEVARRARSMGLKLTVTQRKELAKAKHAARPKPRKK